MLYKEGASPAEYKAGLNRAIKRGWLVLHESETFVKFTPASFCIPGAIYVNAGPSIPLVP